MWGWIAKLLIIAAVFYAIYHVGVKAERGVQEVKYALLAKDYATFRKETELAGAVAIAENRGLRKRYKLQANTSREKYDEKMAEHDIAIAKYKSDIMRDKASFRALLDNVSATAGVRLSVCGAEKDELFRRLARLDERGLREIVTPAIKQQEYALSCNQRLIEIEAIRQNNKTP